MDYLETLLISLLVQLDEMVALEATNGTTTDETVATQTAFAVWDKQGVVERTRRSFVMAMREVGMWANGDRAQWKSPEFKKLWDEYIELKREYGLR
jgi:hypothetical protein